VVEIKEISTCTYAMEFHTPVLCANTRTIIQRNYEQIVCLEDGPGGDMALLMYDFMALQCDGSLAECWEKHGVEEDDTIPGEDTGEEDIEKDIEFELWHDAVDELNTSNARLLEKIERLEQEGLDALLDFKEEDEQEQARRAPRMEFPEAVEGEEEEEDQIAPSESGVASDYLEEDQVL
jgi:hypothetical protein